MSGVVVCVDPRAADEGAKVLEFGGNAFDAAIATAFVQMVVMPFMCGVGGMASAHLWHQTSRRHIIVDGLIRAGSLVSDGMWAAGYVGEGELGGFSLYSDPSRDVGYQSIGVPGTVAALSRSPRAVWMAALAGTPPTGGRPCSNGLSVPAGDGKGQCRNVSVRAGPGHAGADHAGLRSALLSRLHRCSRRGFDGPESGLRRYHRPPGGARRQRPVRRRARRGRLLGPFGERGVRDEGRPTRIQENDVRSGLGWLSRARCLDEWVSRWGTGAGRVPQCFGRT